MAGGSEGEGRRCSTRKRVERAESPIPEMKKQRKRPKSVGAAKQESLKEVCHYVEKDPPIPPFRLKLMKKNHEVPWKDDVMCWGKKRPRSEQANYALYPPQRNERSTYVKNTCLGESSTAIAQGEKPCVQEAVAAAEIVVPTLSASSKSLIKVQGRSIGKGLPMQVRLSSSNPPSLEASTSGGTDSLNSTRLALPLPVKTDDASSPDSLLPLLPIREDIPNSTPSVGIAQLGSTKKAEVALVLSTAIKPKRKKTNQGGGLRPSARVKAEAPATQTTHLQPVEEVCTTPKQAPKEVPVKIEAELDAATTEASAAAEAAKEHTLAPTLLLLAPTLPTLPPLLQQALPTLSPLPTVSPLPQQVPKVPSTQGRVQGEAAQVEPARASIAVRSNLDVPSDSKPRLPSRSVGSAGKAKVVLTEEEKEAKKLRRAEANRISARNTIARKQVAKETLREKVTSLEGENGDMKKELQKRRAALDKLASEKQNLVLELQKERHKKRTSENCEPGPSSTPSVPLLVENPVGVPPIYPFALGHLPFPLPSELQKYHHQFYMSMMHGGMSSNPGNNDQMTTWFAKFLQRAAYFQIPVPQGNIPFPTTFSPIPRSVSVPDGAICSSLASSGVQTGSLTATNSLVSCRSMDTNVVPVMERIRNPIFQQPAVRQDSLREQQVREARRIRKGLQETKNRRRSATQQRATL